MVFKKCYVATVRQAHCERKSPRGAVNVWNVCPCKRKRGTWVQKESLERRSKQKIKEIIIDTADRSDEIRTMDKENPEPMRGTCCRVIQFLV